jgi:type IV pilus assembly protein PilE
MHPQARGFGLIESLIALLVAGLLAAIALPSFRAHQLKSHRADATQALQQLQLQQEQYRERHGRYAQSLQQLQGSPTLDSPRGHYRISLTVSGPDAYAAVASAQGAQTRDSDCTTVSLRIDGALSFQEPRQGCWPT